MDTNGSSDTASVTVFVRNVKPDLSLTPNEVDAWRGVEIEFSTAGTVDPDGSSLCYEWDFDDPASTNDTLTWCTGDPEPAGYGFPPRDARDGEAPSWEPPVA